MTPNLRGGLALMSAMFVFVINDICVKKLTAFMPAEQIMMLRGIFSVILSLAYVFYEREQADLKMLVTKKAVFFRGLTEGLIAILFITALKDITLGDITAIVMISPLLITALSVPILGEKVGWRRWCAVLVGFIGVLFVAKPTGQGLGIAALLAFFVAVLIALRDVYTRKMNVNVPSSVIALSTSLFVFLVGLSMMLPKLMGGQFMPPNLTQWALLFTAALTVSIGNYFVIIAFRGVDVSVVSPFRYMILLFALLAGYVFWGDIPDLYSSIGMACIIGAGLYSLYRERVRARQ